MTTEELNALIAKAEAGDVPAMCDLGEHFLYGQDEEKNLALGVEWLEKAAAQNSPWALEKLAKDIYQRDECKNDKKAFECYLKLAESLCCVDDQVYLIVAQHYIDGIGTEPNLVEAIKWVAKAAERGFVDAETVARQIISKLTSDNLNQLNQSSDIQYMVGELYFSAKDYDNAIIWYVNSAKGGNSNAAIRMNALGVEFQYGNNGRRTIDLPLAYKFYKNSAECGDFNGMANAGYCISNGIGVEKDLNKAFEYFKQAAELGHWTGMSNLGWCYLYGNGTEKDIDKAIHWLTRAAEEGNNIWSMNKLTYIYGELDGYINQEQTAKWFLELIKRDCDPNSGVYENTGYNKELYAKIKNTVLNSTTEEEMMSSMSGGMGGSLLGGAMSFTTSNAKTYISQAEAAIQRNIEYKEEQEERARLEREEEERRERERREAEERARREAEERALLIKNIETDYKDSGKTPITFKGTTFNIPDGTKRIGDYALEKCYAENIVIPETVTSIGINAFRENTRIKSIHIPNSVISIGKYAFSGCQSLSAIDIPNGLTHIEEATFSVTSLTDIKIPDSVTNIGNWAFTACQNLKTLELPNSLISLGDNTVDACLSLETVIVPKGVKDMVVAKLEEADLLNMPQIVEK